MLKICTTFLNTMLIQRYNTTKIASNQTSQKKNCLTGRILGTFFAYNKSLTVKHWRFILSIPTLRQYK